MVGAAPAFANAYDPRVAPPDHDPRYSPFRRGSSCPSTGTGLHILNSFSLSNIDGLSALTGVGQYGLVLDGTGVTHLDGLTDTITQVDTLVITNNPFLTNINGIDGVANVNQLAIKDNDILCQSLVNVYVATVTIANPISSTYWPNNACN